MDIKQSFQLVVLFLACCFPFVILWIHKLQSIHSQVIKEANDTIDLLNLELRILEAELSTERAELKTVNNLLTQSVESKWQVDWIMGRCEQLWHETVARAYEIQEMNSQMDELKWENEDLLYGPKNPPAELTELRAELKTVKTQLTDANLKLVTEMIDADLAFHQIRRLQHELVARAYEIDQLQWHGACRDAAASYEISSLRTSLTGLTSEYNNLLADYDKLWGYQVHDDDEPVDYSDGLEDKYEPPFPYQDGGEDICF